MIRNIPPSVTIETTSFCNRKCRWCPQFHHHRAFEKMSDEMFDKIIRELAEAGFSGKIGLHLFNEPLLDNRLEDLIVRAKNAIPKAFVYIHTNGDAMTVERLRSLRKAGLDGCLINQYEENVNEHINSMISELSPDERNWFCLRMFGRRHVFNRAGLVRSRHRQQVPMVKRCRRILQLCVNYRGDVVLCCNDFLGQVCVGNVRDKNVVDLYNDPVLKSYREQLLRKGVREGLALCDKCDM